MEAKSALRKEKLYTLRLTPRFEIPDDVWAVVAPILFDEVPARPSIPEAYPWFFRRGDENRIGFMRYCEELDCLHEDLDFALLDLDRAYEESYSDRLLNVDAATYFRRLAVLYHAENVDFRVHAYRERVFRLLQHFFAIETSKDDDWKNFNDKIRGELKKRNLDGVLAQLDALRSDPVRRALERRRLFTHHLKERDEWKLLTPETRIDDGIVGASTIDKAERYYNLEAAYEQRRTQINELCERLAQFRDGLTRELVRAGST